MTVGVAGLGLIGGSLVKAYHEAGERVLAWNRTRSVLDFALLEGSADGELNEETIKECDLILVALYPEAAIGFISRMAPYINKESFVIDCCGTKRVVCAACFPIAERYGFTYIGGHPMAGTQYSGYKYAKATLYKGQPMVLVPPVFDDIAMLSKAEELLAPALFGRFSVTPAGPRRLERLHKEPHGGPPQRLLGGQLQGYDESRLAQPGHVGGALPGEQRFPGERTRHDHKCLERVQKGHGGRGQRDPDPASGRGQKAQGGS